MVIVALVATTTVMIMMGKIASIMATTMLFHRRMHIVNTMKLMRAPDGYGNADHAGAAGNCDNVGNGDSEYILLRC